MIPRINPHEGTTMYEIIETGTGRRICTCQDYASASSSCRAYNARAGPEEYYVVAEAGTDVLSPGRRV